MMEAVHHYEGTVNEVRGDGIMALFGAPLAHEDHALRACYAALHMQQAVKLYADEVRRNDGLLVQIRVGLNSGEVVVRSIGSDLRMDYSAVGRTTHLAARMEQLAAPGTIQLTAETLRLVEGLVGVNPLGPVPVKGLDAPIEVFELVGASAARTRLEAAERHGLTRFVGRSVEMEQIRDALDRAGLGRGQVVAVVGEPGVGKSRLVWEVTHSSYVHGWRVLKASSVSYGKPTSYLPVIDLLRGYFGIGDRDDLRGIGDKVTGAVVALDQSLHPPVLPLLALLDVPAEGSGAVFADAAVRGRLVLAQWRTLDPRQRRRRTLDALKQVLLREARVQPLLVIFEDLHWIDGETQALLDSLVESLPGARLMLLVNYRPEYSHAWGSIQAAAVIGKDVALPLLLAIADAPEPEVRADLARLQAAEFLYEVRLFPDLEYTFKHALTHEVAYQGLLQERRRDLHARITEAIERLAAERIAEQSERLAHHALQGEVWEKAVAYLHQAGLRAMARGAHREAVHYLEQALGTLRHLPETRPRSELAIDIRMEMRNALLPLGDWARMLDHLQQAEVLARLLGDQRRLGRIAALMVHQWRIAGDYDGALRYGQEALAIARTLGDRSLEVVATSYLGDMHLNQGEFSEAAKLLEGNIGLEAKLRAERFGTHVILSAMSEGVLGGALAHLGRFDEAIGHGEATVRIAEETDHPLTLFIGLLNLGWVHMGRGDLPRAVRVLEQSLQLGRTWQFVDRTPEVAATLGCAYALAGRTEESVTLIAGAVNEFRAGRGHSAPATILFSAGRVFLLVGRIDEATNYAQETVALTRRRGARGIEAHALALTADIAAASDAENAEGYYREALALAEPRGMRPLVAHCHFGLGKLHRRNGDLEQAQEHLTTAIKMYREMGMTYWPEQAEAEMRQLG
jgi:tetratricopeptide (TPR) repeat protein